MCDSSCKLPPKAPKPAAAAPTAATVAPWRSTRSLPTGCYTISPKASLKIDQFLAGGGASCGTAVLHLDNVVNKLDPDELGFLFRTVLVKRVPVQVAFLQGAVPLQQGRAKEQLFAQLLQLLRGEDASLDRAPSAEEEFGALTASPRKGADGAALAHAPYESVLWAVNLGELKLSEPQLDALCAALSHARCGVTHMFYECTNLPEGRKDALRAIVRANRAKHGRWKLGPDEDQNAVVKSCVKCWFNATSHPCNKRWEEAQKLLVKASKATDLGQLWVGDRLQVRFLEVGGCGMRLLRRLRMR